jgi:curved DNA-binding protein CbpA
VRRALGTLELPAGATFEEAQVAHRELLQVWHPDKYASNLRLQERATKKTQEINAAWIVIRAWGEAERERAEQERRRREQAERQRREQEQAEQEKARQQQAAERERLRREEAERERGSRERADQRRAEHPPPTEEPRGAGAEPVENRATRVRRGSDLAVLVVAVLVASAFAYSAGRSMGDQGTAEPPAPSLSAPMTSYDSPEAVAARDLAYAELSKEYPIIVEKDAEFRLFMAKANEGISKSDVVAGRARWRLVVQDGAAQFAEMQAKTALEGSGGSRTGDQGTAERPAPSLSAPMTSYGSPEAEKPIAQPPAAKAAKQKGKGVAGAPAAAEKPTKEKRQHLPLRFSCPSGEYLSDYECLPLPLHAVQRDGGRGQGYACDDGYHLIGSECAKTPEGMRCSGSYCWCMEGCINQTEYCLCPD